MHLRHLLALSLVTACGGGTSTSDTDAASTGDAGDASTAAPVTTTGEPTSTTTGATSTGEPGTTGEPTSTTTAPPDPTGGPGYCHGFGETTGGARVDFHNSEDVLLTDGGVLPLECGGQGLFMFGLYPKISGFMPIATGVKFDITVDVEGHNSNPSGHFYGPVTEQYYIGCEDGVGGVFGVLPLLPPDNEELPPLDGLPAAVQIVMHANDELVMVNLGVILSVDTATASDAWCTHN